MKKTYFATSDTGTPLLGKSFILKDRANALPDVPMTELGAGHYEAELSEGTAWNVYDGVTDTGVIVDALLADTKEPQVSAGNIAHVYFGNKVFRAIQISDVTGLSDRLNSNDVAIAQLNNDVSVLSGYIDDLASPARTFAFGGKTYSMDPITVLHHSGIIDSGAGKNYLILQPSSGGHPYTVNVPGDGSWVDAFRVAFDAEYESDELQKNFTPRGLLHHINSVLRIASANKEYIPYLNFRYSILESPIGTVDGGAPFNSVGNSVVASQLAYTDAGVGGSDGFVHHSIRDLGAPLSSCGGFLKIKIEVSLKSPGAPIAMTFTSPTAVHLSGQLYPEVP